MRSATNDGSISWRYKNAYGSGEWGGDGNQGEREREREREVLVGRLGKDTHQWPNHTYYSLVPLFWT